jgi:ribosomal protein S18 acetylase RimI-like enzyme
MTTTLRPDGPEVNAADGGRARAFRVCVNGRPVGEVRLSMDRRFGARTGRIDRLEVEAAERRRGRATVAVLAAEEVLRGWGCDRVEAHVPAQAADALALALALGYTERNRIMAKRLAGPAPVPPAGSTVRALTAAEYPGWLAAERADFIRGWTDRGVPHDQATARADDAYRRLLPEGPGTDGTRLRVLSHAGTPVGTVWVAVRGSLVRPDVDAYVYSVSVREEHRGRGHGRSLMREAERICRAAGGRRLGLSVFAGNAPALSLYESLGHEVLERYLSKPLG